MASFKYDVFLSHNSKDKPAVEALAIRLEDEASLKVFLDKWNLVPGEPWQEELEQALAQSRSVAVFLGPSGISGWHNEEMRSALDRRVRQPQRRVIPVLLPGAILPGEQDLPPFLARLTWVDFRGGLEEAEAFRSLVAGISGKPPGRGGQTPPQENRTPEDPKAGGEKKPTSRERSGPTFYGNFQGNYVAGDQTVIHKLEDRSIQVNAPVTGNALVSGDKNQVKMGGEVSLEDLTDLLKQMGALVMQANLPPTVSIEIQADLEKVQAESIKPEPNRSLLLKRLEMLIEVLKNTATIAGSLPQLLEMARQALDWVRALF